MSRFLSSEIQFEAFVEVYYIYASSDNMESKGGKTVVI